MIFSRIDGAVVVAVLDGGPRGGKGLADIEAVVGLFNEGLPKESWFEFCPELKLEREPSDLEPAESNAVGRLTALEICLDCTRELGKDVWFESLSVNVNVKYLSSSISQIVMIILANTCFPAPAAAFDPPAKHESSMSAEDSTTSTTAS